MNEPHPALHAILGLVDADGATQRLAMEVIAQPREQRDRLIRHVRRLYCAGIAVDGQRRRMAEQMGDLLEARLRHRVTEIEIRGGGTIGTA